VAGLLLWRPQLVVFLVLSVPFIHQHPVDDESHTLLCTRPQFLPCAYPPDPAARPKCLRCPTVPNQRFSKSHVCSMREIEAVPLSLHARLLFSSLSSFTRVRYLLGRRLVGSLPSISYSSVCIIRTYYSFYPQIFSKSIHR
jgi:hypothetical protein